MPLKALYPKSTPRHFFYNGCLITYITAC